MMTIKRIAYYWVFTFLISAHTGYGQSVPKPANYVLSPGDTTAFLTVDSTGMVGFHQFLQYFSFIPVNESGNVVKISVNGAVKDCKQVYLSANTTNNTIALAPYTSSTSIDSILWEITPVTNLANDTMYYTLKSNLSSSSESYYLGRKGQELVLNGPIATNGVVPLSSYWKLWTHNYSTYNKRVFKVTAPESIENKIMNLRGDSINFGSMMEYAESASKFELVDTNLFAMSFRLMSINEQLGDTVFLTIENNEITWQRDPLSDYRKWLNYFGMLINSNNYDKISLMNYSTMGIIDYESGMLIMPVLDTSNQLVLSTTETIFSQSIPPDLCAKAQHSYSTDSIHAQSLGGLSCITAPPNNYYLSGTENALYIMREGLSGFNHYTIKPTGTNLFSGWAALGTQLYVVAGDSLKQYDLASISSSTPTVLHSTLINAEGTGGGYSVPVIDNSGNIFVLDSCGAVYGFSSNFKRSFTHSPKLGANYVTHPELYLAQTGGNTVLTYFSNAGKKVELQVIKRTIVIKDSVAAVQEALSTEVYRMATRKATMSYPVNQWSNLSAFPASELNYVCRDTVQDSSYVLMTHFDSILGHSSVEIISGLTSLFPAINFQQKTISPISTTGSLSTATYVLKSELGYPLIIIDNPLIRFNASNNSLTVYVLAKSTEIGSVVKFYTFSLDVLGLTPQKFKDDWLSTMSSVSNADRLRIKETITLQNKNADQLNDILSSVSTSNLKNEDIHYFNLFLNKYSNEIAPIPHNPFSAFLNWMNYNRVVQGALPE